VVVFCYGLLCGEWWYFVMGYCVGSSGIFNGLLCGEWWYFVMGYFVASGGILLWVIVWRVVLFCYELLCGEWW